MDTHQDVHPLVVRKVGTDVGKDLPGLPHLLIGPIPRIARCSIKRLGGQRIQQQLGSCWQFFRPGQFIVVDDLAWL